MKRETRKERKCENYDWEPILFDDEEEKND